MSSRDNQWVTKRDISLFVIINIAIISVVVIATTVGISLYRASVERKLVLANFEARMRWFEPKYIHGFWEGTEPLEDVWNEYHDKGYNGITDPVIIRHIRRWQEEGIAGWRDVDVNDLKVIMEKVETRIRADGSSRYTEQEIEDVRKLLFGGYDILGETDMLRFQVAIQIINTNSDGTSLVECIGDNNWRRWATIEGDESE